MLISIAGVSIVLSGESRCPRKTTDSAYLSFLQPQSARSIQPDPDIRLTVSFGEVTVPVGLQLFFETNESWKIAQDQDFFYYFHQPLVSSPPFWIARINRSFSTVHLVIDERYHNQGTPDNQPGVIDYAGYPLSQIVLIHHMALHNKGLLVHSAGIELNGKGYIFPGRSGAGKSTVIRQLNELDDFGLLSDDRMIVRRIDNSFHAYGTPWPGDAGVAVNKGVPLAGLFFIHHSDHNRVEPLAPKEAVERLMPVSSIPWYDRQSVINLLDFCDDLIASVPAYDLYFKPTVEVADFLRDIT